MTRSVASLVEAPLEDPSRADLVIRGEIESYSRRARRAQPDRRLLRRASPRAGPRRALGSGTQRDSRRSGPRRRRRRVYAGCSGDRRGSRSRALANLAQEIVLDLSTRPR
jgi:hypothetical protein